MDISNGCLLKFLLKSLLKFLNETRSIDGKKISLDVFSRNKDSSNHWLIVAMVILSLPAST